MQTSTNASNETVCMGLHDAAASPESRRSRAGRQAAFGAGKCWPEDESVEDFFEARRRWRREGRAAD